MIKLLAIADPIVTVPPQGYGGTERILHQVLTGLSKRGYEITLLGKIGSQVPGKLIPYPDPSQRNKLIRGWLKWRFRNQLRSMLDQFDVIHAVGRLDYLLPALQHTIPKHYLFQNPITADQVDYLQQHGRGRMVLSGCGKQMTLPFADRAIWRPIHNGVDVDRFPFQPTPRSPKYLAVLGRLTANKGVKEAIQVAKLVNMPLHIAGNISNEPGGKEYFETELKPHIDGKTVLYLGELNDEQKIKHLGEAAAFLNPVQWDEPFGIVTIEALACGTPVIACPRGELPYVVAQGVTGFLASTVEEMANAVRQVDQINRQHCRQAAVEQFSTTSMVDKYDEVLRWLLSKETKPPEHWQQP